MGFNGKSLIFIGAILFIFQMANFISIETITPELERAQVLAAIASLIIILIGFLFKQFEPLAGEKVALKGDNKFLFDRNMPDEVIDELAWGSEAILTSTAAAAILIHNDCLLYTSPSPRDLSSAASDVYKRQFKLRSDCFY